MTLFTNKGWSTIITDDLIDNVLSMVSIVIGLITGLIGTILGLMDQDLFVGIGFDDPGMVGFVIGFLVGIIFSSILMSVVGSAVNTVIGKEKPFSVLETLCACSNHISHRWRPCFI